MMRHEANSMRETTPKSDEVWYVDSGVSNHMTSHEEWFSYLENRSNQEWSKQETTLHIRSNMSVKFPSATSGRKGNS